MSEATLPLPETDEAMLDAVARMDFALAQRVHGLAMAAEVPAEIADLSRTYQRLARSLRQTLALKAQLKRQQMQDRVNYPPPPQTHSDRVRLKRRCEDLQEAVARVAWNEHEADDWIVDCLDDYIAERAAEPDFGLRSLDVEVAEACDDLGFSPDLAARWRDLPPRPDDDEDDEDDENDQRPSSPDTS